MQINIFAIFISSETTEKGWKIFSSIRNAGTISKAVQQFCMLHQSSMKLMQSGKGQSCYFLRMYTLHILLFLDRKS